MKIEEIIERVAALNAETAAPALAKGKKKKAAVAVTTKTAIAEAFAPDPLAVVAHRIAEALNLKAEGVTADLLVARVRAFEQQPYAGTVQ